MSHGKATSFHSKKIFCIFSKKFVNMEMNSEEDHLGKGGHDHSVWQPSLYCLVTVTMVPVMSPLS